MRWFMEEYQWLLDDPDVEVLANEITDFGVCGEKKQIIMSGKETQNCIALFIAENDKIPIGSYSYILQRKRFL